MEQKGQMMFLGFGDTQSLTKKELRTLKNVKLDKEKDLNTDSYRLL